MIRSASRAVTREKARQVIASLRSHGIVSDAATHLNADSRALEGGEVFVAYPGTRLDGRAHIERAVASGAKAVLWERAGFDWDERWTVPNVPVEGLRPLIGPIASEWYGRPSERLWIVGVTGTKRQNVGEPMDRTGLGAVRQAVHRDRHVGH